MKLISITSLSLSLLVALNTSKAQSISTTTQSKYNYHDAFAPLFYTKNGDEYRSAGGQPGPHYWQNRADYQLTAKLDEKNNEITGTAIMTYTNNSPDKLPFIWMDLDQNLFKQDSRGTAIIPVTGSRNGSGGQKSDLGFKIKSIKMLAKEKGKDVEKNLEFTTEDTRMQIYLPSAIRAQGGQLRLKIDYSFIIPIYGSDRMGILDTQNGKIFCIAQWYPRMCVYDDLVGWQNKQFLGQGEFTLTFGNYAVNLTVPSDHIVAATGMVQNVKDVLTSEQQQRFEKAKT